MEGIPTNATSIFFTYMLTLLVSDPRWSQCDRIQDEILDNHVNTVVESQPDHRGKHASPSTLEQ